MALLVDHTLPHHVLSAMLYSALKLHSTICFLLKRFCENPVLRCYKLFIRLQVMAMH